MQYGMERRSRIRSRAHVVIWLACGRGHERVTTTRDLGPGGVRICGVGPVPVGDRYLVTVELGPGRGSVECKGRVIWSERGRDGLWHVGLRFLDLAEEEVLLLEGFMGIAAPSFAAVS